MPDSIFTVIGQTTKALVGEKLDLSGGTLSGPLILNANPTAALGAATKGYVDTELTNLDMSQYAELAGATFTGALAGTDLTLSGNLTVNGSVTALDTANSTIADSLILLAKGTSDNATATSDSGILIERGNTEENASIFWDEGDHVFKFATTTSDATATDLGGTSTAASLEVADLKTNGNDLGSLEDFYGGLLTSSGTATIAKSEFDAVAVNGKVSITGTTSPFASTTITMSYGTPSEVSYELSEISSTATETTVSLVVSQASAGAYADLSSTGNITIDSSVITFA